MYYSDKKGRKIKEQLGEEKIIVDIKNKDFRIKFFKSYAWLFPLIITLSILINIGNFNIILSNSEKVIGLIIFAVSILSTIILFCSESCKIYFEEDYLILENKLRKKKIFDINKYPRIYIRRRVYWVNLNNSRGYEQKETYDLYIEQNNELLTLDIKTCGYEKIQQFIENLEMKSHQNSTEQEWKFSVNDREKIMSGYMKFLNMQGRIIGVKDENKKIRMRKKENLSIIILIIILIIIIDYELTLLKVNAYFASLLVLVGIIINIGAIINKMNSNNIKISYVDGSIIIDKYKLKYKEKNIRITITATQTPYTKGKYDYDLQIMGERNTYSLPLGKAEESKIGEFIDNLNFEEINN